MTNNMPSPLRLSFFHLCCCCWSALGSTTTLHY